MPEGPTASDGWDLADALPLAESIASDIALAHKRVFVVSCLGWKWRKRSSVKITERTHEETTEALHTGRESRHSEEAFGGRSADLGPV